jgi:Zn-dependent protease
MLPSHKNSFHLFRLMGIDVYLHWMWFLAAIFLINWGGHRYSNYAWYVVEYLAFFGIVLTHEFGHALACRSVGGRADQIILWPLGGVAYVDPPQRPGATLWSIAAGPLVNVLLFPVLTVASVLVHSPASSSSMPNVSEFVTTLWWINVGLLLFNMLPIYPLDGGQILRSLLWFMVGRARSLMVSSTIGLVSVAALLLCLLLYAKNDPWLILIGVFALIQCWSGLQQARALARIDAAPRHAGLACPNCHHAPPAGNFWICGHCRQPFDMFASQGTCPHCGVVFDGVRCMDCGQVHQFQEFVQS